MTVLVAGYSARALAQSAREGGWDVVAVDYFGDRDLAERTRSRSIRSDLSGDYRAQSLADLARPLQFDSVVYTGGLENHGDVVASLAEGRELLGNGPLALSRVRDWRLLRGLFAQEGIAFPETVLPGETPPEGRPRWLSKPLHGSGGAGVRFHGDEAPGEGRLLQEFLPGVPASATFLCDGRRSRLVALTEQIVGHRALTERSFAWCGNLFPLEISDGGRERLERMGDALARTFGLRGLNGVDFIVTERDGLAQPLPVEVNPRPAASLEIVEAACGVSLFPLHVRACGGHLPQVLPPFRKGVWGKAVVYSRSDLQVPVTDDWYDRGRRDIPHEGEIIAAGSPICTLLARADDRGSCLEALTERAEILRTEMGDRQ